MATERQIAANRRNAQKSSGPKTHAGKRRARNNAFNHGFRATSSPTGMNGPQVMELARAIVRGHVNSPYVHELALVAGEATVELARLRRLRADLIDQLKEKECVAEVPDEPEDLILVPPGTDLMLERVSQEIPGTRRLVKNLRKLIEGTPISTPRPRNHFHQLRVLDRYERSLYVRRDRAVQNIIEHEAPQIASA